MISDDTPKFHDVEWELGESPMTAADAGLTMGYPLYALTPDGRKVIGLLRVGDLSDRANALLIADTRTLLHEIQYLLVDMQGILAGRCDLNLHSATGLAPAAEIAIELVQRHDPSWEDPAAYAVKSQEEQDEEDAEDEEEDEDDEDSDEDS